MKITHLKIDQKTIRNMTIILAIAISLMTYSQPKPSYPQGTNLDHGVIA